MNAQSSEAHSTHSIKEKERPKYKGYTGINDGVVGVASKSEQTQRREDQKAIDKQAEVAT